MINQLLEQRIGALRVFDADLSLNDANARIRVAVADGRAVVEIVPGFPCASLRPRLEADVQRLLADEGLALTRLDLHPRIESGSPDRIVWESTVEADPMLVLMLLNGGPFAPGVAGLWAGGPTG